MRTDQVDPASELYEPALATGTPRTDVTLRDTDLEWFLCEMPALLGETSGHGAVIAALERGPGGSQGSDGAWEAVERARPHVARARRLKAVWVMLAPDHRQLLQVHYTAPACRRQGVLAQLGELAAVALALASDRGKLEGACSHPAAAHNARRIAEARGMAQRALAQAHRAWVSARQSAVLSSWGAA